MHRTRVKICGITRLEDALAAVDAGADALGFVFYEKSPRHVEPVVAAEIIRQLPAFVVSTGLFVNAARTDVQRVVDITGLDLLQFHGDESAGECGGFNRPYIKAVRVKNTECVEQALRDHPEARGILTDAYVEGVPGGTGTTFDWALLPEHSRNRLILAGGLNVSNVAAAVRQCVPYAVDVSGGVEKSKGIKDKNAMRAFVNEVQSAKNDY